MRTSEDSCFSVWVRFLLASARARVSSFGFFAGGGSAATMSSFPLGPRGGVSSPEAAAAAALLAAVKGVYRAEEDRLEKEVEAVPAWGGV
jgi:hypothetical protein